MEKGIYYILDGKMPKAVKDIEEWGIWYGKAERHVAKTNISKEVSISTVFLGLDHSYNSKIPILFETMIFGGKHDGYQERYTTWEQAEKGHERAVNLCKDL